MKCEHTPRNAKNGEFKRFLKKQKNREEKNLSLITELT